MKINKVSPQESQFLQVLKKLALIPKTLYYYGKLPECRSIRDDISDERPKCVAIVGSRKNTTYGEEVAYRAAFEAAKAGAVVVSGLAYGIDSIAHRGALDAGGLTIAVLGTPIDDIYPRTHEPLAREIVQRGGAIISEYAPGDVGVGKKQMQVRFLERNRIIAGLSDVVFIAEAADKSGSLNTASHALDMGIDLMVAPGDITRLSSRGCNRLISQGAMPYTEPSDLVEMLFPERVKLCQHKKASVLDLAETDLEKRIIQQIIDGVSDGEKIIENLGISSSEFFQTITVLEIKNIAKAIGSNNWMLRV